MRLDDVSKLYESDFWIVGRVLYITINFGRHSVLLGEVK